MTEYQNPRDFVDAGAEKLADDHGITPAEAQEHAKALYPKLSHAESGQLFVRLGTGVSVRADTAALQLVTRELAHIATAPDREARIAELTDEKAASGDYTL